MKRSVAIEAKKQAEKVDIITEDVMRAQNCSQDAGQVCVPFWQTVVPLSFKTS